MGAISVSRFAVSHLRKLEGEVGGLIEGGGKVVENVKKKLKEKKK